MSCLHNYLKHITNSLIRWVQQIQSRCSARLSASEANLPPCRHHLYPWPHHVDPLKAEQLAILEQDPCLVVESSSPAALQPAQQGTVDDSGVGGVTPTQIRAAVASLDSENTEHFTQAGKPRVAAVVAALGLRSPASKSKPPWRKAGTTHDLRHRQRYAGPL